MIEKESLVVSDREALAKALFDYLPGDMRAFDWAELSDIGRARWLGVVDALLASGVVTTGAEYVAGLAGDEVTPQDRRDVAAWLIREADHLGVRFPQRRDGVDALLRALATALSKAGR